MKEMEKYRLIERSVVKKYRRELWNPFIAAVKRYRLISEGDRIAVCISGGKDSMLMAVLMRLLQRISEVSFELLFLVMDPGYNAENRRMIEENAKTLNIPITVFETDIFKVTEAEIKSPCYLCARMRRGYLYAEAQRLGCNKIALGHHFSDVIETTLLGMFYGSQLQAMIPKVHSQNFHGMELIRPMYCIHEDDIVAWCNYNDLRFLRCACSVSEKNETSGDEGSKRQEIKELLRRLRVMNPVIEKSIFNSIHSVCLDTFPAYKTDGETHSFLERYDRITAETERSEHEDVSEKE